MSCIILDNSICFSDGNVGAVSVSGSSKSDKPFCSSQWYQIEFVLHMKSADGVRDELWLIWCL